MEEVSLTPPPATTTRKDGTSSARRVPITSPSSERSKDQLVVFIGGQRYELGTTEASLVVVPGVYEGGSELWECAIDLATYLQGRFDVSRLRVVELGCGRGLLGLWAARNGARDVAFCDYNEDVLLHLSPVVSRELERSACTARLYAGDWGDVGQLLSEDGGPFDLVLTAETTYRLDLAHSLVKTIQEHLLKPTGVAFVATKRYYFGTGGGSKAFLDALALYPDLQSSRVWTAEDGASNIRDIHKVWFA